ncbi:hypothetical protein FHS29_004417 [Saccharothrix tamanrassetensis]|uniref:Beta-lactamase class A n=1 Tax=Saccharothrix tamanrassetensis TaxID=1051531 RepID=A0A841CH09_9PSEU|nr:hypothetical protein [Saccharothrix tamanrassetensis]MBB5957822.1 hypothetical protein [Saccharothrix tamanrassetensis]
MIVLSAATACSAAPGSASGPTSPANTPRPAAPRASEAAAAPPTSAGPKASDPDAAKPTGSKPTGSKPTTSAPTAPKAPAAGSPAPNLSAAIARAIGKATDTYLAVSVLDLATGARAGYQDDVPFHTASLSKLIVAVDMLHDGHIDDGDRKRLHRALSASDDDAMNALWAAHDGFGAVGRVSELVGLAGTHAPDDTSQWGDVTMSADDLTRLYQYILTRLPAEDRDFVVDALSGAPPTAADGFDQAFGLQSPGLGAYAKQGWMWYQPADLYLHSAGVAANRYAVALLSVQSGVTTDEARDRLTDVSWSLLTALTTPG